MEIETPKLGKLTYDPKEVIEFPEGLYGFEEYNRYLYVEGQDDTLFSYLQCLDNTEITFIVANPRQIVKNYMLTVSENEMNGLDMRCEEDLLDYVIITIPDNIEEMSANLLGPIIINKKTKIGKQAISLNPNYTTKYQILAEIKNKSKAC